MNISLCEDKFTEIVHNPDTIPYILYKLVHVDSVCLDTAPVVLLDKAYVDTPNADTAATSCSSPTSACNTGVTVDSQIASRREAREAFLRGDGPAHAQQQQQQHKFDPSSSGGMSRDHHRTREKDSYERERENLKEKMNGARPMTSLSKYKYGP